MPTSLLTKNEQVARLTTADVQRQNALAIGGRVCDDSGTPAFSVSLTASNRWVRCRVVATIRTGGTRCRLGFVDTKPFSQLLAPSTRGLPSELIAALAAVALHDSLSHLEKVVGTPLELESCHDKPETRPPRRVAQITPVAPEAKHVAPLLVDCDDAAFAELLVSRLVLASATDISTSNALRQPTWAVLGTATLTVEELYDLTIGDVVLLSSVEGAANNINAQLMVGNSIVALASARGTDLLIAQTLQSPKDVSMSTATTDNALSKPGLADINSIALQARAVLPLPVTRLADIRNWGAGTVLPLNTPVDSDRILIQVGDQHVARGRLVLIDQQLGLEIVELASGLKA